MSTFMITLRTVSGANFGTDYGAARYLIVPPGVGPAPSHETTLSKWLAAILATFPPAAVTGGLPASSVNDIVFVVHGFNNTIKDASALHETLAKGLADHAQNYSPTLVSFDWPSIGQPYAYLPDLDTATYCAVDLVNKAIRPMLRAQKPGCQIRINCLAHSMGAFLLRKALSHADDGIVTGTDWMIGQLALVAGDVEASDFASDDNETLAMLGHAYRLTNYFNQYDEVLAISNAKRAGVEPRVGRVGLPPGAPDKTVNVNCSARYASLPPAGDPIKQAEYSHAWYFTDPCFLRDLGETLKGATDRGVIAGRTPDDNGGFALAVG